MVDVSVIIPYHQDRGYLFDAIESYEAQEFTDNVNPNSALSAIELLNTKIPKLILDILNKTCLIDQFEDYKQARVNQYWKNTIIISDTIKNKYDFTKPYSTETTLNNDNIIDHLDDDYIINFGKLFPNLYY